MHTILKIFFTAKGVNSWAVLGCLLLASMIEGIGYASLVPLLTVATGMDDTDQSPLIEFVRENMLALGIPMEIGVLLFFFTSMMIFKSIMNFLAMTYVGNSIAVFSTGIRKRLINSLLNVKWSYMVQNPLGRFTNAISAQTNRASTAYEIAANFFAQAIQSLVYLAVSFFISWVITTIAIGASLVIIGGLHSLVRMARKTGARQTIYMRELMIYLVDTLTNIKPVRAMNRQVALIHLLEEKLDSLKKAIRRAVISSEGLKSGQDILLAILLGAGFYIAITYWQMPIIELAVAGLLLKKSTNAITKIQRLFQQAKIVEPAYLELSQLIAETKEHPEYNSGTLPATFERGLQFQSVEFHHDKQPVLHSVSFEIPAGHVIVLTGPSGSGKTTLIDILTGLYPPDNGKVLIDDIPMQEIDLASWRRLIGYVPQEPLLFHDSILSNISLGEATIGMSEVREALQMAGALDFVDAMPEGVMTMVGQHGAKLSGGQRQRIAIARALVLKPRLLILDEVTSALDARTEGEICSNISQLSDKTTVLAITHRPAMLEIADKVYAIHEGVAEELELPVHPDRPADSPQGSD